MMKKRYENEVKMISVVIPVYKEIGCLDELIGRTLKSCEET